MPGDEDPVGGGLRETGDGRGTLLTGAVKGKGAVQGVRGVDGGRIIGGTHNDTAWASSRVDMELENLVHVGRALDVLMQLASRSEERAAFI